MSICRMPRCESASTTAFWTAGVDPIVPDSPIPFAPRGLFGLGVSVVTGVLDRLVGVGRLVRIAVEEGRAARPGLQIGVCGEHGGDPESVHFFHEVGLDYVSCSPFRVPVARLEAGRAAIASEGSDSR